MLPKRFPDREDVVVVRAEAERLEDGSEGETEHRLAGRVLARRDMHNIERLQIELNGRPLLLVPHLDDDVHDIEGLLRVRRYLFASETERERMLAEVVA